MNGCKQLAEHYEAYALGALEGRERAEIEAHLAGGCSECSRGVAEARALVANLAYLAPDVEPPARLRERVATIAKHKVKIFRRPTTAEWGWVTAAAAVLILSLLHGFEVRLRNKQMSHMWALVERERQMRQSFEEQLRQNQQALAVISAGREVALTSQDAARGPIRAYWSQQLGLALTARNVSAPVANRTLQLWVVPKKGNPISAGVFRPDANGGVLYLTRTDAAIADAAALAVSEEPAGGSPQPTSTPIWVGALK